MLRTPLMSPDNLTEAAEGMGWEPAIGKGMPA